VDLQRPFEGFLSPFGGQPMLGVSERVGVPAKALLASPEETR
jgi:hypothetical protein